MKITHNCIPDDLIRYERESGPLPSNLIALREAPQREITRNCIPHDLIRYEKENALCQVTSLLLEKSNKGKLRVIEYPTI